MELNKHNSIFFGVTALSWSTELTYIRPSAPTAIGNIVSHVNFSHSECDQGVRGCHYDGTGWRFRR